MNLLYAASIAILSGCGVYLMLSRHIIRFILGITVLSAATNLLIFYSGRITSSQPPVILPGEETLSATAANPLSQALILTAIVIGFALTVFMAALALQTYRSIGSLDGRDLHDAERLGSPSSDEPAQR